MKYGEMILVLLLPAIDLKDGQCVRLYKGNINDTTVYSNNPVEVALRWENLGAEMLHLVDLDGAFTGSFKNLQVIKDIIANIKIPVQLGGGIRTLEAIDGMLGLGIKRVIIGTAALTNPKMVEKAVKIYSNEVILLGIDSKYGKVAVEGWEKVSDKTAVEFALELKEIGIERVVYTDISRDGTLEGLNLDSIKELAVKTGLKIVASGGVASIDDLIKVMELETIGVDELIIGKALYTGNFDLQKAIKIAKGETKC